MLVIRRENISQFFFLSGRFPVALFNQICLVNYLSRVINEIGGRPFREWDPTWTHRASVKSFDPGRSSYTDAAVAVNWIPSLGAASHQRWTLITSNRWENDRLAILEELCLIGADNSVARVRTLIRAIGSSFNFTTPVVTVAYSCCK